MHEKSELKLGVSRCPPTQWRWWWWGTVAMIMAMAVAEVVVMMMEEGGVESNACKLS